MHVLTKLVNAGLTIWHLDWAGRGNWQWNCDCGVSGNITPPMWRTSPHTWSHGECDAGSQARGFMDYEDEKGQRGER